MDKTINIGQIMTTDVTFLHPDDTISKVNDIFQTSNIHHLPVVEKDGTVIGIISKSDFFYFQNNTNLNHEGKAHFESVPVKDVMVRQVAMLYPEDSVDIAAGIFRENLFHAMPIVDKEKKLLGILSTCDLLNFAFRDEVLLS